MFGNALGSLASRACQTFLSKARHASTGKQTRGSGISKAWWRAKMMLAMQPSQGLAQTQIGSGLLQSAGSFSRQRRWMTSKSGVTTWTVRPEVLAAFNKSNGLAWLARRNVYGKQTGIRSTIP